MSPKLNWATKNGLLKSAVPMTAMTHAAILRTAMPEGVDVVVVSENLIRIEGLLARQIKPVEVYGTVPQ